MAGMGVEYRNSIATHGGSLVTHIGLVDETGTELTGGAPAYARRAVIWTTADDGTIRPTVDLLFDVPAGGNISGWRGFSALTAGIDYGGQVLTREDYTAQGTHILLAANTGILHTAIV